MKSKDILGGTINNFSCVNTSVELHHLDSQEMIEKATWGFHKDITCCFEQIGTYSPHKTAVVCVLIFYLMNSPRNTIKTCWVLLVK